MQFSIKKEGVGECNINIYGTIPVEYQYAIKSLASLQLMFMNNKPEYKDELNKYIMALLTILEHVDEDKYDPVKQIFQ